MSHLYVIQFSTGVIKVGRSENPEARIATHKADAARFDVTVEQVNYFPCAGDAKASERKLIEWCVKTLADNEITAPNVSGEEWFVKHLSFSRCASKAHEISKELILPDQPKPSVEALKRAAVVFGGQAALSTFLGYPDRRNVAPYFRDGGPAIPHEKCPLIEFGTFTRGGGVSVQELRPDVRWFRVPDAEWPHPDGRPLADFAKAEA